MLVHLVKTHKVDSNVGDSIRDMYKTPVAAFTNMV